MERAAKAEALPATATAARAPFLDRLKAPRSPAAPVPTAEPAPAPRDEPAATDAPLSDESFESATLVPRSVLADRDLDRANARGSEPPATRKPPPPLDEVVAKIPAETIDALEQLFRARIRTVRRIPPEQLR